LSKTVAEATKIGLERYYSVEARIVETHIPEGNMLPGKELLVKLYKQKIGQEYDPGE